jgi:membrane protein implicated in regulation of membrane protease activity
MQLATPSLDRFTYSGLGAVESTIAPTQTGRVHYQATHWPARLANPRCTQTLNPGDVVQVVGRQGLTLLVQPYAPSGGSS